MPLSRYYKRIILLPTLLIVGGFVAFTIYDLNFGSGKDYKSEWLTADSFDQYVIGMVIVHCLIVSGSCLGVFFNRRLDIRGNPIWSFLSWFLLPMLYLGYLLYLMGRSFYDHVDEDNSTLFILSLTLPYMISLTLTFIQFRRSLKVPSPPAGG